MKRILVTVAMLLTLTVLWEWRAVVSPEFKFFFSQPTEIVSSVLNDIASGELTENIRYTLSHVGLGYALGTLIGFILGISLWRFTVVGKSLSQFLVAASSVPVFALAPMLIVWFGVGFLAKVAIVILSIVFSMTYQVYAGAKRVDAKFDELSQSFSLSQEIYFRKVLIPGTLRESLGALKLNLGFALVGGFVAEWISSQNGIGHYILAAMGTYDYARVIAGILSLFAISLVMTGVVSLVDHLLTSRGRHI